MQTAVFSAKNYDREFLGAAGKAAGHALTFFEPRLDRETCKLAEGFSAVCPFVNDVLDAEVLARLAAGGARLIALRCAGFNNVDLPAAAEHRLRVTRVPAYSPYAVAEHAMGLILTLNRRIHKAYNRVREGNFALDGLLGFDLHGRTAGVVGTGKIGQVLAQILSGFGCRVLLYDIRESDACRAFGEYVPLDQLLAESDMMSLHLPLTPDTRHLIDAAAIARMKPGVMLINTSRGGLIDTRAVIEGLKEQRIGYLGLDVYEEEADLFFEDLSSRVIRDDVFSRLLTFPNVVITGHQAFFTREALSQIAQVTMESLTAFERGEPLEYEVTAAVLRK
ncbi:MAG: 2-hydroxyacid dehydrogenase [Planctomycetes bacterium]|nr:2-hydroxyacid dehydrogenase [Planctomycetota bacterium]